MAEQIKLDTYNICIGDVECKLVKYLDRNSYNNVFVLVDENTAEHCLPILKKWIKLEREYIVQIQSGEKHKNIHTCQMIWQKMVNAKGGRKDLLINLGGGVIGDMGGFCASTFKRGIDFIQIPTTLLSQVDASIGGKLGIDFAQLKNSVGLFVNPKAVFIHNDFLKTLDKRELRSGFAEMVKHSLIANPSQWYELQKIDKITVETAKEFLKDSLHVKQQIVEEDPYEKGIRKALNFGHTIGHAVESHALESGISLLHGEAIAIGMVCESYLSWQSGFLAEEELEGITRFIVKHFGKFESLVTFSTERLMELMLQDKKNDDDRINFTMLNGIGSALINQFVSSDKILDSLKFYQTIRVL